MEAEKKCDDGVAFAKGIGAIADVARASIPEVAEIEYSVNHARCIARFNFSGVDESARDG